MSLDDNNEQNKEIISKPFFAQNDLIQEINQKEIVDNLNIKKNENQFPSSTISSIKNQDLIKNDSLKIIPDFLITSNEANNKCNFFQSKKVTSSEIKESENIITSSEKLCCNCTKTKCIKKYCECFSNNRFCKNCHCANCKNNPESSSFDMGKELAETDQVICTCTKSNCNKKYCECYKSNQKCTYRCRCVNCKNGIQPSFSVNVPESDTNINVNKEESNTNIINNNIKDIDDINNNIVDNNTVDKNEIINLGGDKNKKMESRKNSNNNEDENESYQIQRVSVFINKYKTVINVEKFTKEMMLISKKRKRFKKK